VQGTDKIRNPIDLSIRLKKIVFQNLYQFLIGFVGFHDFGTGVLTPHRFSIPAQQNRIGLSIKPISKLEIRSIYRYDSKKLSFKIYTNFQLVLLVFMILELV
jgi:hypothetical protein